MTAFDRNSFALTIGSSSANYKHILSLKNSKIPNSCCSNIFDTIRYKRVIKNNNKNNKIKNCKTNNKVFNRAKNPKPSRLRVLSPIFIIQPLTSTRYDKNANLSNFHGTLCELKIRLRSRSSSRYTYLNFKTSFQSKVS